MDPGHGLNVGAVFVLRREQEFILGILVGCAEFLWSVRDLDRAVAELPFDEGSGDFRDSNPVSENRHDNACGA